MNSDLLQIERRKCEKGAGDAVGSGFVFLRESVFLLFRFPADRTVSFLRSKKQSCSTRRGLCVDTDLVEF